MRISEISSCEEGVGKEKKTMDLEKDTLHTGNLNRQFLKSDRVGNKRFRDIAQIHLIAWNKL